VSSGVCLPLREKIGEGVEAARRKIRTSRKQHGESDLRTGVKKRENAACQIKLLWENGGNKNQGGEWIRAARSRRFGGGIGWGRDGKDIAKIFEGIFQKQRS